MLNGNEAIKTLINVRLTKASYLSNDQEFKDTVTALINLLKNSTECATVTVGQLNAIYQK